MARRVVMIFFRYLGFLVVVGIIAIAVFLYRNNRRSEQFTTDLERLSRRRPEVVLPGSRGNDADDHARAADVKHIQSIYDKHNEAWCRGDGEAYASVFTADADFIAFDGSHTIGRTKIAASHQELFDRHLQNTCLEGAIDRVKFLSADIAIAYVRSGTRFDDSNVVRRPSIQTYVAVRQDDDGWLFTSFHNGRIDPVQDRNLLRLAWLAAKTWVFRR